MVGFKPEDFPEGHPIRAQIEKALGTVQSGASIGDGKTIKFTATQAPADPNTLFAIQLIAADIDGWQREYKFHPGRKFRFDFAWPEILLAVEIDGGTFKKGPAGHKGAGFRYDLERTFAAAELGWQILRGMPEHVGDGQLLTATEHLIRWRTKLFHVAQT